MERMRHHINEEIDMIRNELTESQKIDYYHDAAEFIEPCSFSKGVRTSAFSILHNNADKIFYPWLFDLLAGTEARKLDSNASKVCLRSSLSWDAHVNDGSPNMTPFSESCS